MYAWEYLIPKFEKFQYNLLFFIISKYLDINILFHLCL
jgi:hypothetical protein